MRPQHQYFPLKVQALQRVVPAFPTLPLAAIAGVAEVRGPRDRTCSPPFPVVRKEGEMKISLNGTEVKLDIPQLSCDVLGHWYGEG